MKFDRYKVIIQAVIKKLDENCYIFDFFLEKMR